MAWSPHPRIYEINTWVWLGELSRKSSRPITFKNVPKQEWDAIARLRVDAVWFMGVWERSPAGLAIARANPSLMTDCRRALPDLTDRDIVGSPYCVRRYVVDAALGGPDGLAEARKQLAGRGLGLMLDFVPNHVAPDHPWVDEHPEYFVRGDRADLERDPASFLERAGQVYACGRDPYFPAWPDVLQLNAFDPGLRRAAIETVSSIADQCDGVRCDMAMLFINSIFERTWGKRAGSKPSTEYWTDLITTVKATHRQFVFMAEAYWDLEWELQQQGFDYCYDKRLYDRMEHGDVEPVRQHLQGDPEYRAPAGALSRKSRRAQSRCDVSAGQASRGGGGGSFTPGRQAASRRTIPGATNESHGVSRTTAGGNIRISIWSASTRRFFSRPQRSHFGAASGRCANVPVGRTI